jgi:DNA-binding beta-propeller fold protein YncE
MRLQLRSLVAAVALLHQFVSISQAVDMIYVTMATNNKVLTYDVSLASASAIAASEAVFVDTGLSYPLGIALDQSGKVYVANKNANSVSVFTGPNTLLKTITGNSMNGAYGLTVDAANNLYVANNNGNNISKFDSSGNSLGTFGNNTNASQASGLSTDGYNSLYVAAFNNAQVTQFSLTGSPSGNFGSNASGRTQNPVGVANDKQGNFYVTNGFRNYISVYDPQGVYMKTITDSSLNNPHGIGFDPSGNAYVMNFGNSTISKFNSSGVFQFAWNTNGQGVYLALAPNYVPEPSTYALGAIATIVMAAVARRRKARKA